MCISKTEQMENLPPYVRLQQYLQSHNEAALLFHSSDSAGLDYCVTVNAEHTIFNLHAHPQTSQSSSELYSFKNICALHGA